MRRTKADKLYSYLLLCRGKIFDWNDNNTDEIIIDLLNMLESLKVLTDEKFDRIVNSKD